MNYQISIGDKNFHVTVDSISPDGVAEVQVNGAPYTVRIDNFAKTAVRPAAGRKPSAVSSPPPSPTAPTVTHVPSVQIPEGGRVIRAPISGLIIDIKVKIGDQVRAGQTVATLEAMKMENKVISAADGRVKEILVQKGTDISTDDIIMIVE
jgi:biotin carboxyl carrier protein